MATTASEAAVAPLTILLFGPMLVLVEGLPLPHLRSRKGLWLLALLVLRHGRPVEREWLAGTLWPDMDQSQAFDNLRPVLSELRKALGSAHAHLQSPNRHSLMLDLTGAEADVLTFDAAIASQDPPALERAVSLYRGPLLEGCTEEWVSPERAAREQSCMRALQQLADSALAAGDCETASGFYRRAVRIDPWWEAAQRGLMEALAKSGDTNAALQVYREL
jgi:DNA-binding SARP family transcriptional activator